MKSNTVTVSTRRLTSIPSVTSSASLSVSTNVPSAEVKSPSYYQFLDAQTRKADFIILDTRFIMKTGFDSFVRDIAPLLKKNGKTLICLQGVVKELRYLASAGTSAEEIKKANVALDSLNLLSASGVLVYKGNPNSNDSGCAAIVKYAAANLWDYNLLVLTQDAQLASDLQVFAKIKSAPIEHPIVVKRLSDLNGRLGDFDFSESPVVSPSTHTREKISSVNNSSAILRQRFGI